MDAPGAAGDSCIIGAFVLDHGQQTWPLSLRLYIFKKYFLSSRNGTRDKVEESSTPISRRVSSCLSGRLATPIGL